MVFGIFSCSSFSCQQCPNRCKKSIAFLQSKGHKVILGSLFNNVNDKYRSGSIIQRAQEFNELLEMKCDIYLSAIGGFCANSITPLINYDLITKDMIFVGCSDATTVLVNIVEKTKAKVIYGPALITHFGEWEEYYAQQSYDALIKAIQNPVNEVKEFEYWTQDYKNWDTFTSEKQKHKNSIIFQGEKTISGNLYPINLSSFSTAFNKSIKKIRKNNTILFIEDSNKDIEMVEKLFSFLVSNKLLKNVSGVIFGKYENFDDKGSKKLPHQVFIEITEANKINIKNLVYYIDCGHTHPTNALIFNKKIFIDFENKKIWQ
ncbi:LD-carboxypeptidase [Spiroplasma alleghenense]|uniref:LD-carboxypeptidase n=1 Tax=Spiroplasma alleghenense TaxID=216931 RepID=A0A345Z520_9MOLU|nr:LD-carboxypeptidase [Spiroplasma alleghenense]AXK51699.1 hypothetical protein SALLE_v1c10290 [Spiroplasma alleghenense]